MPTITPVNTQIIEVRSATNDNIVHSFEVEQNDSVNIVTAGYDKICKLFSIDRISASQRYYVERG